MSSSSIPLELISVASLCTAPWEAMTGDDRTRFCGECQRHVYNLSDLSRTEAEILIQQTEGQLCVRYFRRRDGTIQTSDCPVGLQAVRRRLRMVASVAVAGLGLLIGGVLTVIGAARHDEKGRRLRDIEPIHSIVEWFSPSPPPVLMGRVCMPEDMPPPQPAEAPDAPPP
jgi:hypothetical protein